MCHYPQRGGASGHLYSGRGEWRHLCFQGNGRQHRSAAPPGVWRSAAGGASEDTQRNTELIVTSSTCDSLSLCLRSLTALISGTPRSSRPGSSLGSSVTPSPYWHSTTHTCTSWAITRARGTRTPYTWLCHALEALCVCPDVFISVSSRMESSVSSHSTPDTHSNIDTLSEQDEGTMTPPSKQATPTTSPLR